MSAVVSVKRGANRQSETSGAAQDRENAKKRLEQWLLEQPMIETYKVLDRATSTIHRLDFGKRYEITGMMSMLDHIRAAAVDYELDAAKANEQVLPTQTVMVGLVTQKGRRCSRASAITPADRQGPVPPSGPCLTPTT